MQPSAHDTLTDRDRVLGARIIDQVRRDFAELTGPEFCYSPAEAARAIGRVDGEAHCLHAHRVGIDPAEHVARMKAAYGACGKMSAAGVADIATATFAATICKQTERLGRQPAGHD